MLSIHSIVRYIRESNENSVTLSLDQPCGNGVSHRRDESPPMDLVPDDAANNFRNDDQTIGSNKYVSILDCIWSIAYQSKHLVLMTTLEAHPT